MAKEKSSFDYKILRKIYSYLIMGNNVRYNVYVIIELQNHKWPIQICNDLTVNRFFECLSKGKYLL